MVDYLNTLPTELLDNTLSYLPVDDLRNVRLVCKRGNNLAAGFLFKSMTLALENHTLNSLSRVSQHPALRTKVRKLTIDLSRYSKELATDHKVYLRKMICVIVTSMKIRRHRGVPEIPDIEKTLLALQNLLTSKNRPLWGFARQEVAAFECGYRQYRMLYEDQEQILQHHQHFVLLKTIIPLFQNVKCLHVLVGCHFDLDVSLVNDGNSNRVRFCLNPGPVLDSLDRMLLQDEHDEFALMDACIAWSNGGSLLREFKFIREGPIQSPVVFYNPSIFRHLKCLTLVLGSKEESLKRPLLWRWLCEQEDSYLGGILKAATQLEVLIIGGSCWNPGIMEIYDRHIPMGLTELMGKISFPRLKRILLTNVGMFLQELRDFISLHASTIEQFQLSQCTLYDGSWDSGLESLRRFENLKSVSIEGLFQGHRMIGQGGHGGCVCHPKRLVDCDNYVLRGGKNPMAPTPVAPISQMAHTPSNP